MKDNLNLIQAALNLLKSDHVQNNKFRLGVLGSQDIDFAIGNLEMFLQKENKNKNEKRTD